MEKNEILFEVNQNCNLDQAKNFKCQVGSGGLKIHTKKKEDKATPMVNEIKIAYYRSDKMLKPIIR